MTPDEAVETVRDVLNRHWLQRPVHLELQRDALAALSFLKAEIDRLQGERAELA